MRYSSCNAISNYKLGSETRFLSQANKVQIINQSRDLCVILRDNDIRTTSSSRHKNKKPCFMTRIYEIPVECT